MSQRLPALIDKIDRLVQGYLAAQGAMTPQISRMEDLDIQDLLEHGLYPPSDPRSEFAKPLSEMAQRLKAEGGVDRLKEVISAYRQVHGFGRAATLERRWWLSLGD